MLAVLAVAGLVACGPVPADASQHEGVLRVDVTRSVAVRYLLYQPATRPAGARLPVLLYLHGGSLRGDDVTRLASMGLPARLARDDAFPFIVVSPLCARGEIWTEADAIDRLLDHVIAEAGGDPARVYVMGHSMGGRGALYFAFRHPERFAAVVAASAVSPIAEWASRVRDVPVWYVHGVRDAAAPVADGDAVVAALRAAGGDVTYSRLEDRDHFILDRLDTPEVLEWLLRHRRAR